MTIKDISRLSGYAVSTVSRALNGHPDVSKKARAEIERIVKENKFVPNSNARQLKQAAGKNVMLIINGTSNTFFAPIIEEIQFAFEKKKIALSVHYVDERANIVRAGCKLVAEEKPLGVIFLGGNTERFAESFSQITIPCVLCTSDASELNFENLSSVCVDDEKAGRQAIDTLYKNGHTKIGFVGGNGEGRYASSSRLSGSIEQMRKLKLDYSEQNFAQARFSFKSGYEATKTLLERKSNITAIFAMADIMAIGAMRAIFDMGLKVPQDISLIGFDGIKMAEYTNPRLVTFRQPADELAKTSVNLLIEQMGGQAARHILLEAELIDGESLTNI